MVLNSVMNYTVWFSHLGLGMSFRFYYKKKRKKKNISADPAGLMLGSYHVADGQAFYFVLAFCWKGASNGTCRFLTKVAAVYPVLSFICFNWNANKDAELYQEFKLCCVLSSNMGETHKYV